MKKLLFLFILCGFMVANAQENPKEKIKALKTAYITQHLELSPQEAEKFWPIYNKYDKNDYQLRKSHRNINCSINDKDVSDKKAQEMLQEYRKLEEQRCSLRSNMISDLSNVLPPKKLINLKQVENDFHKKLIKEYRSRKNKEESKK